MTDVYIPPFWSGGITNVGGGGYSPSALAAYNNSMGQSQANTNNVINQSAATNQNLTNNLQQGINNTAGYAAAGAAALGNIGAAAAPGTYSPGNAGGLSSFSGSPMFGNGGDQTYYQPTDLGPSYGYTPQGGGGGGGGGFLPGVYYDDWQGISGATQNPPPSPQPYLLDYTGSPYPGGTGPSSVSRDLYYDPDPGGGGTPIQFPPTRYGDPYTALSYSDQGASPAPYSIGGGGWRDNGQGANVWSPGSFDNPAGDYSPGAPAVYGGGYQPFAPSSTGDRYPLYGQPGGAQPQQPAYNPFDYSRVGEAAGYPSNTRSSADMPDWARNWSIMDGSNPWFAPGGGGDAGASGGFTSAGDFGGGIDWSRPQGPASTPPFNAMNNYDPGMWGDTQNLGRGVGRDDIAREILRQQMPGLQTPGNLEEMRSRAEEEMRRAADPPGPQSYYDGGWGGSTMSG